MSIEAAYSVEVYRDDKDQIGFYVVLSDGTMKDYRPGEWQSLGDSERKELERLANKSQLWSVPRRPTIEKYSQKWDSVIRPGVDEGKLPEVYGEYVEQVMTDVARRLEKYYRKFCYFEDDNQYAVLTTFAIQSYNKNQFEKSPVLLFDGVTGSGKSTALTALKYVCYRGLYTSDYSTPSLVDEVVENNVTLLLDESTKNLSSERGADIKTFLINGFDRMGAVRNRKDMNTHESMVKNHYTCVAITTMGGEIPIDLRNRSMMITLSIPDEELELEDIGYMDDAELDPDIHPDSIRTDLYALKILTDSEKMSGIKKGGIVFEPFRHNTRRRIKESEGGRYLYGYVHDIKYTPKITGRDKAIAYAHYTIGQTTRQDEEIIHYILDNMDSIWTDKSTSIESVMMKAFADLILEQYETEHPRLQGVDSLIEPVELKNIVKKMSMPEIHKKYRELRTLEGWDTKDMEAPKTLTLTFKKLRIPYEGRGGRTNYINPSDPDFILNFRRAVKQFLDREVASYFKKI